MDEEQKITITVETKDGHGMSRTFMLNDDGIQNKDWTLEIAGMVEALSKQVSEL